MSSTNDTPQNAEKNQNSPASERDAGIADAAQPTADSWEDFARDHADELDSLSRTASARRFEQAARKRERQAAQCMQQAAKREQKRQQNAAQDEANSAPLTAHGPRDYETNWLDADATLDHYAPFEAPDPQLEPPHKATIVFSILCVVGVLGLIAAVVIPPLAGLLGGIFGACLLIGAIGLLTRLKSGRNDSSNTNFYDDGARV